MNLLTILILCWLACAPIGYLLNRWSHKAMSWTWTRWDRLGWLMLSILNGPIGILGALAMHIAMRISMSKWAKGEAKW
jgi:hypothetical protein